MRFFAGRLLVPEQRFGMIGTQLKASLLTVGVIAVLIPTAFRTTLDAVGTSHLVALNDMLVISRGVSDVLTLSKRYADVTTFIISDCHHSVNW